uniref:Acylglycerol kinase, mitochondrial n=1 Tax=Heliothis virescens TaxID=7102 RepID=A0A2A4K801_HELVI
MERITKLKVIIRTNWKKSVLGAIALCYGAMKAKEKYEINLLMRAACREASKYGDGPISIEHNPTHVTVILNPVANKRNAKHDFEKYCEPLLHLAGLQVDVIQTSSEGNAKELVETLRGTQAIVIAGGDGTVSETVTGLLRRNDDANQFPLGILPLGHTNTIGNTLFETGPGVLRVKQLIEASMAIIKGSTVWKDAMKVEPLEEDGDAFGKPIYALCSLEWGAFRDVSSKKHKYWLYGSLREYASYIFNGYRQSLTWHCKGTIKYTPPCDGCSNCLKKRPQLKRKWSFFVPTTSYAQVNDPTNIVNSNCDSTKEICFQTSDFRIMTPNVQNTHTTPALSIGIGKYNYKYTEFVSDGWRRVRDNSIRNAILARSVILFPKEYFGATVIDIDREEYEAKPIKVTLMPKVVKLFCKQHDK